MTTVNSIPRDANSSYCTLWHQNCQATICIQPLQNCFLKASRTIKSRSVFGEYDVTVTFTLKFLLSWYCVEIVKFLLSWYCIVWCCVHGLWREMVVSQQSLVTWIKVVMGWQSSRRVMKKNKEGSWGRSETPANNWKFSVKERENNGVKKDRDELKKTDDEDKNRHQNREVERWESALLCLIWPNQLGRPGPVLLVQMILNDINV